jgi:hypothetical protein
VIELENTFPFSFAVLVLAQIFCVIIINWKANSSHLVLLKHALVEEAVIE